MYDKAPFTIKIWVSTHSILKVLGAITHEPMTALLDRLAHEEAERMGIEVKAQKYEPPSQVSITSINANPNR